MIHFEIVKHFVEDDLLQHSLNALLTQFLFDLLLFVFVAVQQQVHWLSPFFFSY